MLPVRVVRRLEIAREAVAIWLAAPGAQQAPAPYLPGQFISLAVPAQDGVLYRSYSLSGDGSSDQPWEITVKRQHAGKVSSFLYSHAEPGMLLYASPPRGAFTLPQPLHPNMPIVFVAAGSGIAPVYGMLRAIALLPDNRRPRVQLHYASDSPVDVLYGRELASFDSSGWWLHTWHYLSSRGQRLTPETVLDQTGALTNSAHWYICGPEPLKRAFEAVALRRGVPVERIHVESFGDPAVREAARSGAMTAAARIRLPTGEVLHTHPGEMLLEALERSGHAPPSSCRVGSCGDCRLRVASGRVLQPDDIALTARERADGYVLSCVGRPVGDVTLAHEQADLRAGGPRRAKVALRTGVAVASAALFVGTLALAAGQAASAQGTAGTSGPAQPAPTPTVRGQTRSTPAPSATKSHIATQPPAVAPTVGTGAS
jgi:ferredoxin-NADP reductase